MPSDMNSLVCALFSLRIHQSVMGIHELLELNEGLEMVVVATGSIVAGASSIFLFVLH